MLPPDYTKRYDAIIVGGAFSGAAAALLLRRNLPEARILLIEKTTEFDFKVGESTSEVAGCFITRVLGLSHHLACRHIQKNGLRLWFNAPGNEDPGACTEIGPYAQSRFATYQLDRSILDEHMLATACAERCDLVRPANVREIVSDEVNGHQVTFKHGDITSTATATWLIDASGKAAMMARKLGKLRPLEPHPVNSMWVRFSNVRTLDEPETRRICPNLAKQVNVSRTSATNHLMGHGWWAWIIPLSNGDFSAGVTYDERIFTPPDGDSLPERIKTHLLSHPIGKLMFENAVPVAADARAYKHLPYYTEQVAGSNWICVGDAAGFMDPLYSQGLDYCGHTVYCAVNIITQSLNGACVKERIAKHNRDFQTSYTRWYYGLYHNKYHYMGDAECMNAAYLMDIAAYFLGPVRQVYENTEAEFNLLPYDGKGGKVFGIFMAWYNRRLVHIAAKLREAGRFGENNLHKRYFLPKPFDKGNGSLRHMGKGIWQWIRLECRVAFLPQPKEMAAGTVAKGEAVSQKLA